MHISSCIYGNIQYRCSITTSISNVLSRSIHAPMYAEVNTHSMISFPRTGNSYEPILSGFLDGEPLFFEVKNCALLQLPSKRTPLGGG